MNTDMWQDKAACRHEDPDTFYIPFENGGTKADLDYARDVCATCPVAAECLSDALANEDTTRWGMRGGLTPKQRNKIAREQVPA